MPMNAGTVRCVPSTNTERWAWSWKASCSVPRHEIPSIVLPLSVASAGASVGPVRPVLVADDEPEPRRPAKTAMPPRPTTAARARAHHHDDDRLVRRARATAPPRGRLDGAGRFAGAALVPAFVAVEDFEAPDEPEEPAGRAP